MIVSVVQSFPLRTTLENEPWSGVAISSSDSIWFSSSLNSFCSILAFLIRCIGLRGFQHRDTYAELYTCHKGTILIAYVLYCASGPTNVMDFALKGLHFLIALMAASAKAVITPLDDVADHEGMLPYVSLPAFMILAIIS